MHAPLHTDQYTALKTNNSSKTFPAMNPVATECVNKKHMAGGKLYPTIQTKNCHFVWSVGTQMRTKVSAWHVYCAYYSWQKGMSRHKVSSNMMKNQAHSLICLVKGSVRNLFKNSIEMHWKGLGVTLMALLGLAIHEHNFNFYAWIFRNQFCGEHS